MTRDVYARWTCNACGVQHDTSASGQPKGWVGYGFTTPDVPNGEHEIRGHLCVECAARVCYTLNEER